MKPKFFARRQRRPSLRDSWKIINLTGTMTRRLALYRDKDKVARKKCGPQGGDSQHSLASIRQYLFSLQQKMDSPYLPPLRAWLRGCAEPREVKNFPGKVRHIEHEDGARWGLKDSCARTPRKSTIAMQH
jgi:hypothetical protein